MKVGIAHCEHLLKMYDPSDTLAPPILKESEHGIPEGVQGEVDTGFEGKVSQGPTTDMSRVGPPAAWVREHGGTVGCPAVVRNVEKPIATPRVGNAMIVG